MPTADFPAIYASLASISLFVETETQKLAFTSKERCQISLSVDEACANIIDHAYSGETSATIHLTALAEESRLLILIEDRGSPCDLDSIPEPDLTSPLEERRERGLGVYTMRQLMDEVRFERLPDGRNRLTMIKYTRAG